MEKTKRNQISREKVEVKCVSEASSKLSFVGKEGEREREREAKRPGG
jgi:hypothetical protein